MKIFKSLVSCLVLTAGLATVASSQVVYDEAEKLWHESRNREGFADYSMKFAEFTNENRLDSKDHCYDRAQGQVEVILIIDDKGFIKSVLANVTNSKADCFKQSYLGLRVPPPPFAPFFVAMTMR